MFRFARQTAVVRLGRTSVKITKGEARYANDPVVLAHPGMFADEPTVIVRTSGWTATPDAPIETVTANPGEKRRTTRGPS